MCECILNTPWGNIVSVCMCYFEQFLTCFKQCSYDKSLCERQLQDLRLCVLIIRVAVQFVHAVKLRFLFSLNILLLVVMLIDYDRQENLSHEV